MTSLRSILLTCSFGQICCTPIIYELDEQGATDSPIGTSGSATGGSGSSGPIPSPSCDDDLCGPLGCDGTLLTTDFNDATGWILEAPWQIGPAQPSNCADQSADDPLQDHSLGPDEQLAGALIGECLPTRSFPSACLTSPPLTVQVLPDELWLHYWSILNTTGAPLDSRVEVFDAQLPGWLPLAEFPELTAEPDWTEHLLDLTPYISQGLRVRFCHSASGDIPMVGGWSLDDISIGPPMCE